MREIRQSGSEGGAGYIPVPTPIIGQIQQRPPPDAVLRVREAG